MLTSDEKYIDSCPSRRKCLHGAVQEVLPDGVRGLLQVHRGTLRGTSGGASFRSLCLETWSPELQAAGLVMWVQLDVVVPGPSAW